MSLYLQREIETLKKRILTLSTLVEEHVARAVKAVESRDVSLAHRVIDSDAEIDLTEIDVEEECLKILALHQPVAVDLRFIIAVLKINNDLERIGDLAVNIAERAVNLAQYPVAEFDSLIPAMEKKTRSMLKDCLDALVSMNIARAQQVCAADDEVDDMHREMFSRVRQAIIARPESIDSLLHHMSISRYLERIADHVTNVAEDIIYLVEGRIVRHKQQKRER